VPLDASAESLVMAVLPKKDRKKVLDAQPDVARFPKQVGAPAGLPDTLEVLAESRDAPEQLLSSEVVSAIAGGKRWFRLLHVTDQAEMAGW
jgi:hypothetical protein